MIPLVVVLENLRSIHNVGSILRTADGAGVSEVIMSGYTATPPDQRIEKVSLGAEHTTPWKKVDALIPFLEEKKKSGYQILALEQTPHSQPLSKAAPLTDPAVIILGNEVEGVSAEVLERCSAHLHIPMRGYKKSLNVSVAAGIAFYALLQESAPS